mgnify:FL=1
MLADPTRCSIVLVTLPESTPVSELFETATAIRTRVGAELGPVVVNAVDRGTRPPDPATVDFGRARAQVDDALAAATFRRARQAAQGDALQRVRDSCDPVVTLPWLPVARLDRDDIGALVRAVRREVPRG